MYSKRMGMLLALCLIGSPSLSATEKDSLRGRNVEQTDKEGENIYLGSGVTSDLEGQGKNDEKSEASFFPSPDQVIDDVKVCGCGAVMLLCCIAFQYFYASSIPNY